MLFNSYIFIFLFLPIALIGYYLCNTYRKYELGKAWLTVMSLWFYGYFNASYLLLICSSILVNYGIYKWMQFQRKKQLFAVGLLFNLGLLFYFKYFDFFITNMNQVFHTSAALRHILLPLGISFFTFQQISFIIDAYRGETGNYSFLDYALFVTFFPQLIAGPIVTHSEMIPQFQNEEKKRFSISCFSKGAFIFGIGLLKKVIVADTLGQAVDWGYQNIPVLDSANLIFVMLCYVLQLYFDFSGYCDMARGIGYFFGIEIPLNFNSPYKSRNISEFWTRWHMTLNRFMVRYLYIPLGGNRKGTARTYVNLLLVFFISGIWHGANWTFIIWGSIHGIACILYRIGRKWFDRVPTVLAVAGTFLFHTSTLIFFRSESVSQALTIWRQILQGHFGKLNESMMEVFNLDEFWYVLKVLHLTEQTYSKYYIGILFFAVIMIVTFAGRNVNELAERFRPKVWNAVALAGIFIWCVISLSGVSTFLYFNF